MNSSAPYFRQITFLGGPLNGEGWPIDQEVAFFTCGNYTYMPSKDDKSVFTPSGMSTTDTRAAMKIELEITG